VTADDQPPQVRQHSPCSACAVRESSLCGVLMEQRRQADWGQVRLAHESARARQTIYRRGERTEDMIVICEGWAFRFVQLSDGRRQILSLLLPGDYLTALAPFHDTFEFSVQALTDVRFCRVSRNDVRVRLVRQPDLFAELAEFGFAEKQETDEQLFDLGKRMADERIAGLILRLMSRLQVRGEIRDHSFRFPLRQQHIADITGLTPVHVSRVIGTFRKRGLLDIAGGVLTIRNMLELRRVGGLH
jgi:CRP/FNR family transcriptional regulator, anaerobic regulatory protein